MLQLQKSKDQLLNPKAGFNFKEQFIQEQFYNTCLQLRRSGWPLPLVLQLTGSQSKRLYVVPMAGANLSSVAVNKYSRTVPAKTVPQS